MNARGLLFGALGMGVAALLILGGRALQDGGDDAPQANLDVVAPVTQQTASLVGEPPAEDVIQVFKAPTCGCCGDWIDHLREAGFQVEVQDIPNMMAVKAEVGLPGAMASCHTARINGYLVEGHVPADDIRRLLAERPDVKGIAVPGMPVGSPGMEVEGRAADPYQVLAFDEAGNTEVYATY